MFIIVLFIVIAFFKIIRKGTRQWALFPSFFFHSLEKIFRTLKIFLTICVCRSVDQLFFPEICRRPIKAALGAVSEHIAGLLPLHLVYSQAHENAIEVGILKIGYF